VGRHFNVGYGSSHASRYRQVMCEIVAVNHDEKPETVVIQVPSQSSGLIMKCRAPGLTGPLFRDPVSTKLIFGAPVDTG